MVGLFLFGGGGGRDVEGDDLHVEGMTVCAVGFVEGQIAAY